jgi:predicted AAA+ superfamily ATPase
MLKITRKIKDDIESSFFKGKVIIIYGARQVGKTTLVKELQMEHTNSVYWNCDEPDIQLALQDRTSTELLGMIGNAKVVFLDEAQRVKGIGITLKLLVDSAPDIQIVATGSSSFELANIISEPLTGRNDKYTLFPFSSSELSSGYSHMEISRLTEQRIIYGSYPEPFFLDKEKKEKRLAELAEDYVFKDIFLLSSIRKSEKIVVLLKALALQIGSEVSYSELGAMVGLNYDTVEAYITALEQSFVIFRLPPYLNNARNSIKKSRKIYFWDTGIRNALINNFNPLLLRNDAGALFENFFIADILKEKISDGSKVNSYFWRDYLGKEIDLILEKNGAIESYECKLQSKEVVKREGGLEAKIVTKDNYLSFLLS